MDIYIEPDRNTIVIRQRWKYNWLTSGKVKPWSYVQKRDWHNKADTLIWNSWGNGYEAISVSMDGTQANKYLHRKIFKIEFDIEWVLSHEHWLANVTRVPAGTYYRSNVDTTNHIVNVITSDLKSENIDSKKPDIRFTTFKHEYGHTFYYTDDYGKDYGNTVDGPYIADLRGMMNIGEELRTRYVRDINTILNSMIPQIKFAFLLK